MSSERRVSNTGDGQVASAASAPGGDRAVSHSRRTSGADRARTAADAAKRAKRASDALQTAASAYLIDATLTSDDDEAGTAVESKATPGTSTSPSAAGSSGRVRLQGAKSRRLRTARSLGLDDEGGRWAALRIKSLALVSHNYFTAFMGFAIVVNSVLIGIETSVVRDPAHTPIGWVVSEHIFTAVFSLELVLKLLAMGKSFFSDSWNVFDFVIVGAAVLDVWILNGLSVQSDSVGAVTSLRILRMLRIGRLLRLVGFFESLYVLVLGLAQSFQPLFWVAVLMVLILFLFSVFAVQLIARNPVWEGDMQVDEWFGDVPRAAFTLFQIMTLEGWSEIYRHVGERQPAMWVFFLLFILLTTLSLMNMVTGIIVEKTMAASKDTEAEKMAERMAERAQYEQSLMSLFAIMDSSGDGKLSADEMQAALARPEVQEIITALNIRETDIVEVHEVLDADNSGEVDFREFVSGLVDMKEPTKQVDVLTIKLQIARLGHELSRQTEQQLAGVMSALDKRIEGIESKLGIQSQPRLRLVVQRALEHSREQGGSDLLKRAVGSLGSMRASMTSRSASGQVRAHSFSGSMGTGTGSFSGSRPVDVIEEAANEAGTPLGSRRRRATQGADSPAELSGGQLSSGGPATGSLGVGGVSEAARYMFGADRHVGPPVLAVESPEPPGTAVSPSSSSVAGDLASRLSPHVRGSERDTPSPTLQDAVGASAIKIGTSSRTTMAGAGERRHSVTSVGSAAATAGVLSASPYSPSSKTTPAPAARGRRMSGSGRSLAKGGSGKSLSKGGSGKRRVAPAEAAPRATKE